METSDCPPCHSEAFKWKKSGSAFNGIFRVVCPSFTRGITLAGRTWKLKNCSAKREERRSLHANQSPRPSQSRLTCLTNCSILAIYPHSYDFGKKGSKLFPANDILYLPFAPANRSPKVFRLRTILFPITTPILVFFRYRRFWVFDACLFVDISFC